MRDVDTLILGGGVAGLAAALPLGDGAVVLERNARPGGLVRTECFSGYWFDHVLHLLHVSDAAMEARFRSLLGDDLARCPPEAWVETTAGTTRFPFQMNLHGLDAEVVVRCLRDLARVTFAGPSPAPRNFHDVLLSTFGREMCELFLFPYNRKVYRRPLEELAPAGFQWTITPPDFDKVLRGALGLTHGHHAYNANGWYPRPPRGAGVRGMEILTRALAARVDDLRLEHEIESIDTTRRIVVARNGALHTFGYRRACSTLPLPVTIMLCDQAPHDLKRACASLPFNRVLSVAFCVEGPRPTGQGHWRYYADESLIFNRLVFPHEFDPLNAPDDGWGLMAEITLPGNEPMPAARDVIARTKHDIERAGAFNGGRVRATHIILAEPAYVLFTEESRRVTAAAMAFLRAHDIEPMGRYGRWEYSSMAQVIGDAIQWAESQEPARDTSS
jgi:protoporphyrinogen oxidase